MKYLWYCRLLRKKEPRANLASKSYQIKFLKRNLGWGYPSHFFKEVSPSLWDTIMASWSTFLPIVGVPSSYEVRKFQLRDPKGLSWAASIGNPDSLKTECWEQVESLDWWRHDIWKQSWSHLRPYSDFTSSEHLEQALSYSTSLTTLEDFQLFNTFEYCHNVLINMAILYVAPSDTPAATPPPGVTPNFLDPYSKGPLLVGVGSVLLFLMLLSFGARIFTKYHIIMKRSWDDCELSNHWTTNQQADVHEKLTWIIGFCAAAAVSLQCSVNWEILMQVLLLDWYGSVLYKSLFW